MRQKAFFHFLNSFLILLIYLKNELDRILIPLEEAVKDDHTRDLTKDVLKVVTEKLDDQLKLVKTVEKTLIDKSHSDLSLLQPLQVNCYMKQVF